MVLCTLLAIFIGSMMVFLGKNHLLGIFFLASPNNIRLSSKLGIVTWLGTPKLTLGSIGFITEKSGNIRPGSDKHPPFFRKTLELNGKSRRCYNFDVTQITKTKNCLKHGILLILKAITLN